MNLPLHLSRVMTKGRDYVPQVDGLRFLAIMGVIAYHVRIISCYHYGVPPDSPTGANGIVNWTFAAGCNGVELFFTISGFILGLPFARQYLGRGGPVRLKAYYLRRVTRLEPPYLIHLTLMFLAAVLFLRHLPSHAEWYRQPHWLATLSQQLGVSLVYGSGFVYQNYPALNTVLWSLEIEVQFYLLAPLLARVFLIANVTARRLVLAGLMILPAVLVPLLTSLPVLGWTLLNQLQFFMAGFLLSDLYLAGRVRTERRTQLWDFIFLGAFGAVVGLHRYPLGHVTLPWLALLACVAAFRGQVVCWLLGRPLLTTIGGMCYTIYMYHWLLISGLLRVTLPLSTRIFWLDQLIQFALLATIIIGICTILFVLFERPFMQRDWPQIFLAWVTGKASKAESQRPKAEA